MSETGMTRAQLRQRRLDTLRAEAETSGTTGDMFPTAAPAYSLTIGEAMRAGTAIVPEGEVVVTEGKLAALAHEINTRFAKADHSDGLANDHRLAAAIQLAAARDECERLRISFKSWVEGNIPQSYDHIRKMAVVGRAENPALALADLRSKMAAQQSKFRAREAQKKIAGPFEPARDQFGPPTAEEATAGPSETDQPAGDQERPAAVVGDKPEPTEAQTDLEATASALERETADEALVPAPLPAPEPKQPDELIMQTIAVLNLADVDLRRKLADEAAARLPLSDMRSHLRVVAENLGVEITRAKGKKFTPTLDTLRQDFDTLALTDRAEFLRLAAESIGAQHETAEG